MADIHALDYDGDDPTPHACACGPCVKRAEFARLKRQFDRVTTFEVPDPPKGKLSVTVILSRDGRVRASGHGDTEEEALYEAFRQIGLVA